MHDKVSEPVAARAVALSPDQVRIVRAITERVVPGAEVFVFGSRATGRGRPFSDLDLLVVRAEPLSWAEQAELQDRFEASELPFRVDVVEAGALSGVVADRVYGERVALAEL